MAVKPEDVVRVAEFRNRLVVIPTEVVHKSLHRGDATERSMGPLGVVLVDPARQALEPLGVGAIESAVRPLGEERLDEPLGPYIVLERAKGTDGAVAGEPDAMVALRCATGQPVAWHRQGVPAIAGHGAARLRLSRMGPTDRRTRAMARSLGLRVCLAQDCRPSSVGRGHLMDICGSIAHMGQVHAAARRSGTSSPSGSEVDR